MLRRARVVLRQRGLPALLAAATRAYVVDRREFYLYEHHHREWPDDCFRPRLMEFEERFIVGNEQADLLSLDHEDFRATVRSARRALRSGAVAYCVYVNHEVAHVAWLATSRQARVALDHLGYEVFFDEGEAWTGAAWTVPSYRQAGLLTYSCHRRFEYLLRSGFRTSRAAVETRNAVSHRATMRFEPRVYATGRQWRVFGRRWWTERQLEPGARPGPCAARIPP